MPRFFPKSPPTRSHRRADPAADHARRLARACELELAIRDRTHPPSDAAEWARSGAMALTGPRDAPPRFARGPLASAARGAGMLLAALAPGSALERLDGPALLAEHAHFLGRFRRGRISAGGSARLLPTRNGMLALNLPREDDWRSIPAWLEIGEPLVRRDERDWRSIERIVSTRATETLVDRGRMMGLALAPARRSISTNAPPFRLHHASQRPPGRARRPIRLLDLSNLWAGPLAASLLAMAGIDVLKIESPTRPDGARAGHTAFFDLMNENKAGCALDLHDPRDRSHFERLLEGADLIVESARPRALEQLGFDAPSWLADKPGRIWASITGHGRSNDWIAFGDDAAMAAGLAWSPDPVQGDPCFCADAIADPISGLHLAALVLAHLRKGRGGLLELSLVECVSHAASLAVEDTLRPIEWGPRGWQVVESGTAIPVAPPRARPVTGRAPALRRPDPRLLSRWDASC